MTGRFRGKVAFITGAARGQGRSHAVRLAQEGADIIAVDLCEPIDTVPYGLATSDDLVETAAQVEAVGSRVVALKADVRDLEGLRAAVDEGVSTLGRLDIVSANAGISGYGTTEELEGQAWQDVIDVNLTGTWHTAKVAIPHLRASGGGSIILTSSTAGLQGLANLPHYVASKHGVVGLVRALALELAADGIRVNSIHPTSVLTGMIQNDATHDLFTPDLDPADRNEQVLAASFQALNLLPVPWLESSDVSNAVLWLASDEAKYITGITLPIDAGMGIK